MWIKPPYGLLFPRGANDPNISYKTMTQGDLATIYYYVTPVPRATTYTTDRYGTRNKGNYKEADIFIAGSSYVGGAGSSDEDTPAAVLSQMTGKNVLLWTGRQYYHGYDNYEVFALWMKHQIPVKAPTFVFMLHDRDLYAPPAAGFDPNAIKKAAAQEKWQRKITFKERFLSLKSNIKDLSRWGIVAKKIATYVDHKTNEYLFKKKKIKWSTDLDVLVRDGKVHGFLQIPKHVADYRPDNPTLLQYLVRFVQLNQVAKEAGVNFVVVLHPDKSTAYNRYSGSKVKIDGYGPAAMLYYYLQKAGVKTIFLYPPLFEAVDQEINNGGPMVYWSDDTHWAPHGIKIAMFALVQELKKLGLL